MNQKEYAEALAKIADPEKRRRFKKDFFSALYGNRSILDAAREAEPFTPAQLDLVTRLCEKAASRARRLQSDQRYSGKDEFPTGTQGVADFVMYRFLHKPGHISE